MGVLPSCRQHGSRPKYSTNKKGGNADAGAGEGGYVQPSTMVARGKTSHTTGHDIPGGGRSEKRRGVEAVEAGGGGREGRGPKQLTALLTSSKKIKPTTTVVGYVSQKIKVGTVRKAGRLRQAVSLHKRAKDTGHL